MAVLTADYDEALVASDLAVEPLADDGVAFMDDDTGMSDEDAPAGEREPLDDDAILNIIATELDNCLGRDDGELTMARAAAIEAYEGRMPRPPKGRSDAVSTDVADVIEWTLPQVVAALTETENVVTFPAGSRDDEQQAQLEADACEHVLFRQNPGEGFIYVYTLVKDALLQKNGIGKVYWDDATRVEYEQYRGLTEEEAMAVLSPEDGSVTEPVAWDQDEQGLLDLDVRRYSAEHGVRVEPMAPEDFLLCSDHNSILLDRMRFGAHRRIVTESDLIAEGWDADMVRELPEYGANLNEEKEARQSIEDEREYGTEPSHRAVRRIQVFECYAMIDQDQDGVAERLQVHVAGDGPFTLMGWEYATGHPFVGTTAILMSHKFIGRSLYDRCVEIQKQKTRLVRAIQDNLEMQNNSRLLVVAGQVNLDDLLTNRPGGIVRQKEPGMVEPLVAPQIGELGYRHLEYLDNVRTGRAGVSPDTASVADAIAGDTAHGLERLMSAKEELTGLMVKLFAHTLMAGTIMQIRGLLQRHRKSALHFQARGEWQQVNPTQWRNRTGAIINPALAMGDRIKRTNALAAVLQQQQQAAQTGGLGTLVTEENIYNALTDFIRSSPLGDPSPYWTDPNSPQAQQARQAMQQQQQQQMQMQHQQQMVMLQAQAAIEENREATKRMQAQMQAMEKQARLIFDQFKFGEEITRDYTQMELDAAVDIAGRGQESKPSPWTS